MNSLNSILIEGVIQDDSVLQTTPRGLEVCSFTIAVSRAYKQYDIEENEISYFDVDTWGKLGEECKIKCLKGLAVRVAGRMKQERWTDDNGRHQSKLKVIAEHVDFKPMSIPS